MGKSKKGFNWKSRQVLETAIDNSKTKKIVVDLKGVRSEGYDDCNALVIPSEKRKTKTRKPEKIVEKILSKKQRRLFQQIVDRKKKKETRASLLAALSEVKASSDLLEQLVPITAYQTHGLKRIDENKVTLEKRNEDADSTSNVFKNYSKRRKLLHVDSEEKRPRDYNVVGFEVSSESSDENTDNDTEDENLEDEETDSKTSKEGDSCVGNVPQNDSSVENKGCSFESTNSANEKEQVKEVSTKVPMKCKVPSKPAVFVPLDRLPGVQEARMKLPILGEEQTIMEAIAENDVLVLAGETGSGKTTQLPQFLYEAGFAKNGMLIGITEPRRVAAISMSKRVAYEMGLSKDEVSYLIRYEGNVSEKTQVKFMTDGVLLKETQSDFVLSRYSVILLDEAHERSVYTDILLGLLSRIVPLRRKQGSPLKLVVMSATLRIEDFVSNRRLFPVAPPVINVESRQFPVTIHFNKQTRENYVREAYLKTCKIHTRLPDGGILIFVTGQQEVKILVRKLRKSFPYKNQKTESFPTSDIKEEEGYDKKVGKCRHKAKKKEEIPLPVIDLDEFPVVSTDKDEDDDLLLDDEDDEDIEGVVNDPLAVRVPLWVLPLYSLLPGHKQAKVFEPAPPGTRLCVVATNVAETSLTIPSVRYVVDCGKEKRRRFDKTTGVSAFMVAWTSKASANQRAGRAGRTGPGHCYRLYSSAVFNDEFEEFSVPEMQRRPVDDLVLQMKSMGIHKVINFPFPSPPDLIQLQAAERRLCLLGALKAPEGKTEEWAARITPLGQSMAAFPVAPRFAKMLALSHQHGLLPYTICMVAALAVPEVLLDVSGNKSLMQARRVWAGTGNSLLLGDPMVLMRAVGAAENAGYSGNLESFCEKHGLRHKAVVEVRKLRLQLTSEINAAAMSDVDILVDPKMPPPSEEQAKLLRQLLLSGLVDQVGHRVDPDSYKDEEDRIKWKNAYKCAELEEPVRMHSASVLKRTSPTWVVYQEIFESNQNKLFMRGVTAIEPEWLPVLATALCHLSQPLVEPSPHYDAEKDQIICHITGTYGRAAWPLPVVQVDIPPGLMRYKWFAVFFVDGSIFPKLSSFTSELLSSPITLTKTWARLQPRTEILMKALVSQNIDSREKLVKKWKEDSKYLLQAYLKWLPESLCYEVTQIWPPV